MRAANGSAADTNTTKKKERLRWLCLKSKDLHVEVDGKTILNGLDLVVEKGSVHAIMGPNGSGKSTLAHVLAGKEAMRSPQGRC